MREGAITNRLTAAIATAVVLGGCAVMIGPGVTVTKTWDVPDFQRISVNGAMDVEVQVASPPFVRVRAAEGVVDRILIFVEGDTLVLTTRGSFSTRSPIVVHVGVPQLSRMLIDGSGDTTIEGLAGGGLELLVQGSGDVDVSGAVDELGVVLNGSADLDLRELHAKRATVNLRGSGDVDVHATEFLKVSLSGSGDVDYHGDPLRVSFRDVGSGDIKAR